MNKHSLSLYIFQWNDQIKKMIRNKETYFSELRRTRDKSRPVPSRRCPGTGWDDKIELIAGWDLILCAAGWDGTNQLKSESRQHFSKSLSFEKSIKMAFECSETLIRFSAHVKELTGEFSNRESF